MSIKAELEDYDKIRKIKIATGKLAPKIGPAHVFDLPDESNLIWSYDNFYGERVSIDNKQAYKNACITINDMLIEIKEKQPSLFKDQSYELNDYIKDILGMYYKYDTSDCRISMWQTAFSNGTSPFYEIKFYNHKKWFKEAI